MIVQIYGVTTVEDGIAVAKLGAERIGRGEHLLARDVREVA